MSTEIQRPKDRHGFLDLEVAAFAAYLHALKADALRVLSGVNYNDEDSLSDALLRNEALLVDMRSVMERRNVQSLVLSLLYRNTVNLNHALLDAKRMAWDEEFRPEVDPRPLIANPGYLTGEL